VSPPGLRPLLPRTGTEPALSADLRHDGFVHLPGCLDTEVLLPRLRREARRLEASAVESTWAHYGLGDDGSYFSGPMRFRSAAPGPWLTWFHRHPALVRLARTLTGDETLAPTGHRAFMYYTDGSFVHFHTDVPGCTFTFLTCVLGRVPPLVVHPDLLGTGVDELLALAEATAGMPPDGREVPVPVGGLLAMFGRSLPHRRPEVRAGGRTVALATLCYGPRRRRPGRQGPSR
jgi:hypothetical protein